MTVEAASARNAASRVEYILKDKRGPRLSTNEENQLRVSHGAMERFLAKHPQQEFA
jgi:hypothetical protein